MYFKKLKSIAFFLTLVFCSQISFASEESKMFGDFIAGVISSSTGGNSGSVCVFGHDEIVISMAEKNKNLINLDKDPNKYVTCKGVYVAQDKEKFLRASVDKFNRKRILTVSVLENFNENGGMVYVAMGRRNFELTINSKEVKDSGIKLSPTVLDFIINN